jgi:hypothetical protein
MDTNITSSVVYDLAKFAEASLKDYASKMDRSRLADYWDVTEEEAGVIVNKATDHIVSAIVDARLQGLQSP